MIRFPSFGWEYIAGRVGDGSGIMSRPYGLDKKANNTPQISCVHIPRSSTWNAILMIRFSSFRWKYIVGRVGGGSGIMLRTYKKIDQTANNTSQIICVHIPRSSTWNAISMIRFSSFRWKYIVGRVGGGLNSCWCPSFRWEFIVGMVGGIRNHVGNVPSR